MPATKYAISKLNSVEIMIEIHLLEQLVTFAKCGTLSAVAEKLHTSQPALTRSMKKLESDLNVKLFVRNKNRITLNECGKFAAKLACRVLEENSEFENRVKAYDRSLHTISIGFCAPIPQLVLTPILNNFFAGMTISADMTDDSAFLSKLERRIYQLAVVHEQPTEDQFYWKKCGHEDLYISLMPEHPLASCAEVHLSDLDGISILLLSQIGFWANTHRAKTPNTKYLLQVEQDSFWELAKNSFYPIFESGYHIRHGQTLPGRINVPIADSECHTDYYLVSLVSEQKRFAKLFNHINEKTVL